MRKAAANILDIGMDAKHLIHNDNYWMSPGRFGSRDIGREWHRSAIWNERLLNDQAVSGCDNGLCVCRKRRDSITGKEQPCCGTTGEVEVFWFGAGWAGQSVHLNLLAWVPLSASAIAIPIWRFLVAQFVIHAH